MPASLVRTSLPSCRYICDATAAARGLRSCLHRPTSSARRVGVRCNATPPPEVPGPQPAEVPGTDRPPEELPGIDLPPEFDAPPGVDVPMPDTPVPRPGPSIPSPPRPEIPTVPPNPDVPPPPPEVDPPRAPPEVPPQPPDVVPRPFV